MFPSAIILFHPHVGISICRASHNPVKQVLNQNRKYLSCFLTAPTKYIFGKPSVSLSPVGLWSPVNASDSEVMLVKAAICLPTLTTGFVEHHLENQSRCSSSIEGCHKAMLHVKRAKARPLLNFEKEQVASCLQTRHGSRLDQHQS